MDIASALGEEHDDSEEMGFQEYVDFALDNPGRAEYGSAAEYLHSAITYFGTRQVVEDGEVKERYRFFDDPWNDGENAVFGNTEMLNEFADSLQRMARNDSAKMPMFAGKTATGKTELLECMKKGLREYSQTDEGKIYTLKVVDPLKNGAALNDEVGNSFGNWDQELSADSDAYEVSPLQVNPLSLVKHIDRAAGEQLEEELDERRDSVISPNIPEKVDPLVSEFIRYVDEKYDSDEVDMADFVENYVRVVSTEIDDGVGIGEIKSEDEIDSLYSQLFAEPTPGRDPSDPRNWSFNGAFTTGNRGIAILDDADQYGAILEKLQSQVDDNRTKFHGNGTVYSVDTVPVLVANPDDMRGLTNSVKRRLVEFEMNYLTNYAVESELIRKLMGEEWDLLDDIDPEDAPEVIRRPLNTRKEEKNGKDREVKEVEFSPHAVEASAMAEVATRLDGDQVALTDEGEEKIGDIEPGTDQSLDLLEKLELYQKGFIDRTYENSGSEEVEVRFTKEDFDFNGDSADGKHGSSINVTFTRDVLNAVLAAEPSRGSVKVGDEKIDLNEVVLPYEVLEEMAGRIENESSIGDQFEEEARERIEEVEQEVDRMLEEDLLDAIFHGKEVSHGQVNRYLDKLDAYNSEGDETYVTPSGREEEPNAFDLKQDELDLFNFDEDNYEGEEPREKVREFRQRINHEIGRRARRDELPDDLSALDAVVQRVGEYGWEGIEDINGGKFENWNPDQWTDAEIILGTDRELEELKTDTARVKNWALRNMVHEMDYSPASAILSAREVIERADIDT